MALEFSWINDRELGEESVAVSATGMEGTRFGTTNSRDAVRGYVGAAGMPRVGDAWSPSYGALKVSAIRSRPWGGTDNPATGENGRTLWQIEYSDRPIVVLPQVPGARFTRLATSAEQQPIEDDVRAEPNNPAGEFNAPIANGDGTSIAVGVVQAHVHVAHALNDPPNVVRMIGLVRDKPTNDEDVSLPELENTNLVLHFEPGQVQYWDFGIAAEGSILRVVHVLNLAPDFLFRWAMRDRKGRVVEKKKAMIYPSAPIGGFW